jgi:microcystin-dependent protein
VDPFLGEIRLMSFAFPPRGWAFCDGSILQVSQNQALFALLNNRYGGDGRTTFALPDLRGRVPLSFTTGAVLPPVQLQLGKAGGSEQVALTAAQVPAHAHNMEAITAAGNARNPVSNFLATAPVNIYDVPKQGSTVALNAASVSPMGSGQGHPNMQPFLVLNYCIATSGLWPPRQ